MLKHTEQHYLCNVHFVNIEHISTNKSADFSPKSGNETVVRGHEHRLVSFKKKTNTTITVDIKLSELRQKCRTKLPSEKNYTL